MRLRCLTVCDDRILQDHSEGNSLHSQALQTLQERLREAEAALNREQDSYRQMQVSHTLPHRVDTLLIYKRLILSKSASKDVLFLHQSEFASRLARAEAERQTLAESLTSAERRATEEKQRAEELQQQTKTARAAADYSKQELHDYKNKASRILQVSRLHRYISYLSGKHSIFEM